MRTLLCIALLIAMSNGSYHAQTIHSFNIISKGTDRNFIVYEPAKKPSRGKKAPLVICLHGYGDTNSNFQSFIDMNPVADTAGFYVAYPQALTNRAWNSGIGENPGFPTGSEDDIAFLDKMINKIEDEFSIDPLRIYCCGFSNGGFMTFRATCQMEEVFAASGSVGGLMSATVSENCDMSTTPFIMIHGDADDIVPISGLSGWVNVAAIIRKLNIKPDKDIRADVIAGERIPACVKTDTYYFSSGYNPFTLMIMRGGNHNWPAPGYKCDIHASSELWRFFRTHKLVINTYAPQD